MSHTAWPTALDLQKFLTSAKLIDNPLSDENLMLEASAAVSGAKEEFERRTNRKPFLAAAQTRFYDPPGSVAGRSARLGVMGGGRRISLDSGLVALTSLATNITADDTIGDAKTLGSDFWLFPVNAADEERPYEWIEFYVPQWGLPQSVKIVGTFGWYSAIPDDAWLAVLSLACASLVPVFAAATSGGLQQWSEAGTEEMYGVNPFGKQLDAWKEQFNGAVMRYKRPRMG